MMQIRLRQGRLLPMIGKVIAYYRILGKPCLGGFFLSEGIDNSQRNGRAAAFCPDVCVPVLSGKKGERHV